MNEKTIKCLADVNAMLRTSTCSRDVRIGMAEVVADILMANGKYQGFRYLTAHEVPAGEKPGVIFRDSYPHEFPDDSRREYYLPRPAQNGGAK